MYQQHHCLQSSGWTAHQRVTGDIHTTSVCDILGPQLRIWVTLTLSPKVILFLLFYSVLVGIATKYVAHSFINSGKWDRNIQKPIFIECSKLYNNKELEKMFTKNIKTQSTTIMSSRAFTCGADVSLNIGHIGNWNGFQLKLPFVTTDRQSMFFVVFCVIITGNAFGIHAQSATDIYMGQISSLYPITSNPVMHWMGTLDSLW